MVSMLPVPSTNSLSLTNLLQDLPGDGDSDINMAADTEAPLFSCHHRTSQIELHTHVLADHIIYHLGWTAFVELTQSQCELLPHAEKQWLELMKPAAHIELKILGGKRAKKYTDTSK